VDKMELSRLWEVEQKPKTNRKDKIRIGYTHIRKLEMDIRLIALHMVDKTIDAVDVVHGEDTMVINLSDGSSVELIVDTAYMNIQDLDD